VRFDVPVIMVTARRAEEDRLRGFAVGADDYVTKPFSPRELVARVGAVLRRAHAAPRWLLAVGPLELDVRRRLATLSGVPLSLRSREFDLLAYLAAHAGEACPRMELLDQVWGYDFAGDERTIDVHVRRLRDALGGAAPMLRTVWNVGYTLSGE
jgi:DNA-binding response OmpR family regulator